MPGWGRVRRPGLQCVATSVRGSKDSLRRCRNRPVRGRDLCWAHAQELERRGRVRLHESGSYRLRERRP